MLAPVPAVPAAPAAAVPAAAVPAAVFTPLVQRSHLLLRQLS
jgi:hypothetical protein